MGVDDGEVFLYLIGFNGDKAPPPPRFYVGEVSGIGSCSCSPVIYFVMLFVSE